MILRELKNLIYILYLPLQIIIIAVNWPLNKTCIQSWRKAMVVKVDNPVPVNLLFLSNSLAQFFVNRPESFRKRILRYLLLTYSIAGEDAYL